MIDYVTGPDPKARFNYLRLIMFTILPIIVMLLSYVFWLIKGCISKLSKQERDDKTISTIAIIWFLFYPTIVSYIASSITCTDIEGNGVQRLYNDLEEVCFEGKHLQYVYFISVPGMILWAFGVPLLAFFLLRK